MDEEQQILQQLESADWYGQKADELLKKYKEAKTAFAQSKLLSQMEAMMGKMAFQTRELRKYLTDET